MQRKSKSFKGLFIIALALTVLFGVHIQAAEAFEAEAFEAEAFEAEAFDTEAMETKASENGEDLVQFEDENLEHVIRVTLNLFSDEDGNELPITKSDLLEIEALFSYNAPEKITSLSGLEHATNLKWLGLRGNNISDISPLSGLTKLENLDLANNKLTNLSGLENLINLGDLSLGENNISDLSPLANLTKLTYLSLSNTKIKDISKLEKLTNLASLSLFNNKITNINVLSKLSKLEFVDIEQNPLDLNVGSSAQQIVQTLMENDVIVLHDAIVAFQVKRVTKDSIIVEWQISEQHLSYGNGYFDIILSLDGQEMKTFTDLDTTEYMFTKLEDGREYEVQLQLNFGLTNRSHHITKKLTVKAEDRETKQRSISKPRLSGNNATITYDDINRVETNGVLEIDLQDYQEDQVYLLLTSAQINMLRSNNVSIEINRGDASVRIPASVLGEGQDVSISVTRLEQVEGALSAVYDFKIETEDGYISSFSESVTLIFSVNESNVTNASQVKVWYFNPTTEEWENIGGTYADGVVIAETDHFSTYTVFEQEEISEETGSESGESGSGTETDTGSGNRLPDTFTNMTNLFLLGSFFILVAIMLIGFGKRRKMA